jgi:hypothetical protein
MAEVIELKRISLSEVDLTLVLLLFLAVLRFELRVLCSAP